MTFQQKRLAAQIVAVTGVLALILLITTLLWAKWSDGVIANAEALQSLDQLRGISVYAKTWKPSPSEEDKNAAVLFMQDGSATIVDANLQTLIKTLGSQSTVEISRTSVSPPRPKGQLHWHDVTIDLTGTNAALIQFIQAIESSRPALFVERLQIQSNIQPDVPLQTEPLISVQLTVSGATQSVELMKTQ